MRCQGVLLRVQHDCQSIFNREEELGWCGDSELRESSCEIRCSLSLKSWFRKIWDGQVVVEQNLSLSTGVGARKAS